MSNKKYGLFCPIAMATETLEPRWTLLILTEIRCGSTRFNEIRRGVPGISPTLLSKRMKEMERQGLIERVEDKAAGTVDYLRTPMAKELEPILTALAEWSFRNIGSERALAEINPDYLMWSLRRNIDTAALPERRVVLRFHFTDLKEDQSTYWLVCRPGTAVGLCLTDPGFDVDLYFEADSKTFTSAWMGYTSMQAEISAERVFLSGDARLIKTLDSWLLRWPYAEAAAARTAAAQ